MKTVFTLRRDDADLAIHEHGAGEAVLFQHGLGGHEVQVAQVFPDAPDWRRITTECRGHGSSTLGTRRPFSIAMFAEDVIAAADERRIDRFVAGGISMGAAVALHLAKTHPLRVKGLILMRPAWLFPAAPENMQPIREIASLLQNHPLPQARALFAASTTAERLGRDAPDNLTSLRGYFDRSGATAFADVLGDIASDGAGVSAADAARLSLPTLVLGNQQDMIHPLAIAQTLAQTIPHADFYELPAKAADAEAHFASARTAITHFLTTKFQRRSPPKP